MEENIYIKAMEIGYDHNNGIHYSKMKALLEENLKFQMNKAREYTFLSWFLNHFQSQDSADILPDTLYKIKFYVLNGGAKHNEKAYAEIMTQRFYIKGETVKQYVDYLELKEAREQAKNAQKASTIAIGIAILTLAISIYFSATAPKPPFNVNILEKSNPVKETISLKPEHSVYPDNEKDGNTQEVYELNDEINKADELIEYYESDDYKKRIKASLLDSKL